jgi:hypothetical protein
MDNSINIALGVMIYPPLPTILQMLTHNSLGHNHQCSLVFTFKYFAKMLLINELSYLVAFHFCNSS